MDALPTKHNLLLTKHKLKLAQKGYDLLDMKYTALLREIKQKESCAAEIREKLLKLIAMAERERVVAEMEAGSEKVREIWENTAWGQNASKDIPYLLKETCCAIDRAYCAWEQVVLKKQKLQKIEEKLESLKIRLNRTKKRVNALRNIAIPAYKQRVKYITNQLEEHERDELIRLKTARQKIFGIQ